VDLGAINDAALVATTVASELGCAIQQDPLPDLIAFLADKQTLLILDSCEHVIGGAAELADRLLREAPLLHILATSQEALRIEGENVHLLPPLDSPRDDRNMTATEALASPAVQLFMDRASAGGYRSELTDAEAPEVAEICRRLGGIALAIELAASRVSTYGIHGTASLLGDRFALLWKGRRTAPPRHQTLQSTLDWSYNLFSPHERKVLRCLSVFAGIFTLEAAQAVADETGGEAQAFAEAITSLVEKARISIAPAGSANCYRLLDTTRAYATLKLAVSGEADAVARRHALYYADYLGSRALELAAAYGRREMSSFSQQLGNVLAALGWCFSGSGDKAIGVELAARAAPLFLGLSLYVECIRWCERALAALADTDRGTKRELALHEPLVISSIITNSYTEEVKDAPTRGLDLTGAQRDDPHLLDALAGDLRGAHATAARYVVVAEESGTPRDVVVARWLLGATQHLAGNQAAAQRSFEFGFRLAESAGAAHLDYFGHDHYARAHIALARVLWLRGMPDQAAGVAREAINVGARRGHPVTTCLCLFHATPVFLWCGDLDSAEDHIEQLIAQAAKHSLGVFSSGGLALRGELLIARGEMSGGIEALRSAYSDLRFPVRSSRALAEALACSGQAEEAAVVIAAAVAQGKQGIDPFELPDLLRAQGEILLASSSRNWTAAQELLIQSLEMAREQSSPGWELRSAIPLARLWARNGRAGEALEMLEAIYQRFQEGFATTDLVTASRLLDTLKESDPPQ
jgi:predicted ATPase